MAGFKGMAEYSRELKVKACKMYFEQGKKTIEICKELGIRNRAQPQAWFNEYRAGGGYDAVGSKVRGIGRLGKIDEIAYRIDKLTMENELFRNFLQMLERE